MAASFFSFWSDLGNTLFTKRKPTELAWFFCGEDAEESLEGRSFVYFLNVMDGKK